ncbi:phospholipase B-like 1 isoform X2 [Girardinichthys multiradiatus]|uniref:phospholipase B-like 1 isoform X2 n=1 Tax=Girardinichthys multiradiatus TaxID=208333 RepID=UPI001FADD2C3|nr:phospholipase B-like 1 isoform X2 [Girardinichthys multiradiatus]
MLLIMKLCVFLSVHVLTTFAADNMTAATVYWDPEQKLVVLKEGVMETEGDAYGYLNDTLSSTGWSVLEIRAGYGKTPETDELTFFLAGYLEGFLTAQQMMDHYTNMYPQLITDPKILDPVKTFIAKQDSWVREQVKLNKSSDPLWKHMGFIIAQMDGLQAGVADWAKKQGKKPLLIFDVQFLNSVGDLLDLIPALVPSSNSPLRDFKLPGMGHCSALIKGSGLMMTQTTNNVFNFSLFDKITPNSLLAWQRVRLAHSLAHTGEEWAKIFSKYNSGTYNNQYMVVDRSKVKLGHSIDDGALTVVEQIPDLVEYSDQTQALRRGHWPSYNIPFHQNIYILSGYGQMWRKYGEDFSYDLCPRAKIFRRDQADVKDLDSLKHIMRFNDYKKDPYSEGNPCKTICCRNDLKSEKPSPGGCYDTKVTDFNMAGDFVAEAVNGPTTQDGLPPFFWDKFSSISHQGLPRYYNFTFVRMQPRLFEP